MEPMTRQTETRRTQTGSSNTAKSVVGVIFGIIEIILAFRLIFKLLGANPANGFVKAIYNITQFFVGIFEGIFSKVTTSGLEAKSIFEPATFIAMIVVALVAWLILALMRTRNKASSIKSTESTGTSEPPTNQQQ